MFAGSNEEFQPVNIASGRAPHAEEGVERDRRIATPAEFGCDPIVETGSSVGPPRDSRCAVRGNRAKPEPDASEHFVGVGDGEGKSQSELGAKYLPPDALMALSRSVGSRPISSWM